ncbi:Transmembrane protease serine 9 [Trichinella pseudospiralis]|uniref:Transmembrane protease serine 9 n=1 Tax=Trichinella pseudospiralis TaxID=6337 RepID=A0A0V0YG24_TRIPS|nr:Transmembrane protease serine 9 [Trichinella pseudospiralis]
MHRSRSFKVNDDGTCGRPKYQPKFNASDNRITGGEEAIPHSHPWIVFLSLTYGRRYICGGMVLQSHEKNVTSYVLTAAHCVKNIDIAKLIVQAGLHDLAYSTERGRQVVTVSRIIISDLYMENYDHDYAVLVLSSPLKFTDYVIPACLSEELGNFPPGSKCLIAGWGGIDGGIYKPVIRERHGKVTSISRRHLALPTTLMQAVITIIDDRNCSEAILTSYDSTINLCAGDSMGVIGINNHDSGCPLVCLKDGVWSLHGMGVSRSFFDSTQPSVFIQMPALVDFLRRDAMGVIGLNNHDSGDSLICLKDGVWSLHGMSKSRAPNDNEQIKDNNVECGRPKYQPVFEFSENRVTAGVEAIPHSHPWLVFITSKRNNNKCGGVILPSRERNCSLFVLTAAHCIFYLRKEEIIVTAGMHDQSLNNEMERQYAEVKRRVINVTYKKNKNYDYGILILLQPLKFNDYVKPICICKENEHLMPGTKCLIAGWGATDGGAYKPIMPIVQMDLFFLWDTILLLTYAQATIREKKESIVLADSGIPLVCLSEGLWTMYGIARAGKWMYLQELVDAELSPDEQFDERVFIFLVMKICGQIKRERFMIPVQNWNFGFDRYDLFSFWPLCCKVEKRGCNYYLPQIPEIAFLNTGLLHASAWLPFGYPVITGLAVVATAARSLRKYAKHAGSCFIQCCVFVVRRNDVAARACVFFTLCTSLRRRQGGIFRCQKLLRSVAFLHPCMHACMDACLLAVVVAVVWPAMITCRYVRWLINLLPLQLPRASKRSVKRSIQPFRQYLLQEIR